MPTVPCPPRIEPSVQRNFPTSIMAVGLVALFAWVAATPVLAQTDIDVSRGASWAASGTVFSDNSHGSTANPRGAVWSYYHQAGRQDATTVITTLLPPSSAFTPLAFSSISTRFFLNELAGKRGRGYVEVNAAELSTFWNITKGTHPADAFKPAWVIATYTELNPRGGTYDMGGKLSWTLGQTEVSGSIYIAIAKISGDIVTPLFSHTATQRALGTYVLLDDSKEPFPVSLRSISLKQGERLAFGIRGAGYQFRLISLNDHGMKLFQK